MNMDGIRMGMAARRAGTRASRFSIVKIVFVDLVQYELEELGRETLEPESVRC